MNGGIRTSTKMCFMSTARSWLYWNLNAVQVLTSSRAISSLQLLQFKQLKQECVIIFVYALHIRHKFNRPEALSSPADILSYLRLN